MSTTECPQWHGRLRDIEGNTIELPNSDPTQRTELGQATGLALKTASTVRSEADGPSKGALPKRIVMNLRPKSRKVYSAVRGQSRKRHFADSSDPHARRNEQHGSRCGKIPRTEVGAKNISGRLDGRLNLDTKRKAVDSRRRPIGAFRAALSPDPAAGRRPCRDSRTGYYSWG